MPYDEDGFWYEDYSTGRSGRGNGWSYDDGMSNNAVEAYEDGERPLSKWTKQAIIGRMLDRYNESGYTYEDFEGYSLAVLRTELLCCVSWHHTSICYNETYFYDVFDELGDRVSTLAKLEERARKLKESAANTPPDEEVPRKALISFEEWVGSRQHSYKLIKYCDVPCYVYKGWAYTKGHGKKRLSGYHCYSPKYLTRAPKGMGEDFRHIKKNLPKKLHNLLPRG